MPADPQVLFWVIAARPASRLTPRSAFRSSPASRCGPRRFGSSRRTGLFSGTRLHAVGDRAVPSLTWLRSSSTRPLASRRSTPFSGSTRATASWQSGWGRSRSTSTPRSPSRAGCARDRSRGAGNRMADVDHRGGDRVLRSRAREPRDHPRRPAARHLNVILSLELIVTAVALSGVLSEFAKPGSLRSCHFVSRSAKSLSAAIPSSATTTV